MTGVEVTRGIDQHDGEQGPAGVRAMRAIGARITPTTVIVVLTALALGVRAYLMARPGFLLGVTEYDDGSYFGSAIRMADGQLPYRDFVFVQPPGITLLLMPAALLAKMTGTAWAFAVARILTMLAGAASVTLAGLLVRHRGVLATLLTCGICAVHPDAILASRTVMVEPWLVVFCLIGALAVFDGDHLATGRRVIWGGVAFGFAGVIEAWAIVPVLVVLLITARVPRRALAFAGGVAAGFVIPTLPFFALGPDLFYRNVIIAQIGRRMAAKSIYNLFRIRQMMGLSDLAHVSTTTVALVAVAIVVFVILGMMVAWAVLHSPAPPLDWFVLATCAGMAALFLWPPQFHYHFVAFLVPFLAMTLALTAARLLEAASAAIGPGVASSPAAPQPRRGPDRAAALTWGAVAVVTAAIVLGANIEVHRASRERSAAGSQQLPAVSRVVPPGDCVLSDQVSYLIAANRFVSDAPDCPAIDDGAGVNYALAHGLGALTGAGRVPAVAAEWHSALAHSQWVLLSYHAVRRIAWNAQLLDYFHHHFVRVNIDEPGLRLYKRTS
jgi:hypothetical protein